MNRRDAGSTIDKIVCRGHCADSGRSWFRPRLVSISTLPRVWFDAAVLTLCLSLLAGCGERPPDRWFFGGETMGTNWSVQLPETLSGRDYEWVRLRMVGILKSVNTLMSTYKNDSQISQFNRLRGSQWFAVHADVMTVLEEARRISEQTGGAFDITVSPLVELWGFGRNKQVTVVPDEEIIAKARESVGFEKLILRSSPAAIRKRVAGLAIDLSAIAKGYAVDKIAEYLDSLEAEHYLVEIGGEIRTKGRNAQDQPWRIGVERPVPGTREAHRIIFPGDSAVATSGDYRNFMSLGGKRYAHIVDPTTGRPVLLSESAVTVVHGRTMTADALATALMVMGPRRGLRFADEHGLTVLFVSREDGRYRERASVEFRKHFL